MVTDAAIAILRFGYLFLLWGFVISVVLLLRKDIFGLPRFANQGANRATSKSATRGSLGGSIGGSINAKAALKPQIIEGIAGVSISAPSASLAQLQQKADIQDKERGIEVVAGIAKGDYIDLTEADDNFSAMIGRAGDVSVRLDDSSISAHHARLFGEGGNLYVEDLGSTNGTNVDGVNIGKTSGPVRVVNGSVIRIGKNIMEVKWQ